VLVRTPRDGQCASMRLRGRDKPTPADDSVDVAWDGVPSRPSTPPIIRAPRAADLAPPKAA